MDRALERLGLVMVVVGVGIMLLSSGCSSKKTERVAHHWPACTDGQLHVDTADRHRCAQVLRMNCDGYRVEGPMLCNSISGADACAADCPCGLTDFGRDADGWRQCGRIAEDWPLYR